MPWPWVRGRGHLSWYTAPATHVCLGSQDLKQQEFFLGWTKVSGKVDWKMLDEAVCQVFKVGT